jgi:ribosomal protection tetracycline resistance protein
VRTLNLGILAHVDAGKTSLTERLLYAAGVIDEVGSVDHGNTQTDTLALERQRGITIKSAVVSFVVDDVTINLIDTPGHPDFIAEVERVLSVLDGAVLVLSAVEGVQSQTGVLMRTLQRLRIPTLLFVNKIDRAGAGCERVMTAIRDRLTPAAVAMGSVYEAGTVAAGFKPFGGADAGFTAALADLLSAYDQAVLAKCIENGPAASYRQLRRQLAVQTGQALVHPVFFGSAMTGAGVDALTAAIAHLLPAQEGDVDGPASGSVFKIERGPAGEKVAYVRMFSGTVRTRDRLAFGRGDQARVTAIGVFERGSVVQRASVAAGQIAKLWGLEGVQIGDPIGARRTAEPAAVQFAPPTLETVVVPAHAGELGRLHVALSQLAEQDPLFNLRQDDVRQELYLSLYGEVQKEVIQSTLASDFAIDVQFRESTTICIERPIGTGEAVEFKRSPTNPFPLATIGLRIEPAASNTGVQFRLSNEVLGKMPLAFFKAVEDTVHQTLHQGIHGWQVTDCLVTMTHAGYSARHSHAHQRFNKSMSSTGEDYRGLTPLVLMDALRHAGTAVFEPMHRFQVELPADTFGALAPVLSRLRAVSQTQEIHGVAYVLEGLIPAAGVYSLQQQLPALTRGEGVFESAFACYQPVVGAAPDRPRTDHNPLDRKEYLLHVLRRV